MTHRRAKPSGSRASCAAFIGVLFYLIGCAGGSSLPKGLDTAKLFDSETRSQAYREIFPPVKNMQISGKGSVSGAAIEGVENFQFTFFADGPGQSRLYLHSREKGGLFDIIHRGDFLTVIMEQRGFLIQGDVAAEGTPFAKHWGIEPGEWFEIFGIGPLLSPGMWGRLEWGDENPAKVERNSNDMDERTGPELIRMDERTGLPLEAHWQVEGRRYAARYDAWDRFADPSLPAKAAGEPRLLPSLVTLKVEGSKMQWVLQVEKAALDIAVSESIFTPAINYKAITHPLPMLDRILGGE